MANHRYYVVAKPEVHRLPGEPWIGNYIKPELPTNVYYLDDFREAVLFQDDSVIIVLDTE